MDNEKIFYYEVAQSYLDWINFELISRNKKPVDVEIHNYGKYSYSFFLVDSNGVENPYSEAFEINIFAFKLMGIYAGLKMGE